MGHFLGSRHNAKSSPHMIPPILRVEIMEIRRGGEGEMFQRDIQVCCA